MLAAALVAGMLVLGLAARPAPEPRLERRSALGPAPMVELAEGPDTVSAEAWHSGAQAAVAAGQHCADWQVASEAMRRSPHPFHSLAIDSEARPPVGAQGRPERPLRGLPAMPGLPQAGLHEHPAQGPPRLG
ncbi:MAG TPA: hypothetical protein DFS52_03370 [Myxococcales bacterium]|nr:hypothetical protein [Myxococcales bacterium]